MNIARKPQAILSILALVALLVLPWLTKQLDAEFYLTVATRMLIYAIAATSLNLLIGYGGMISFGHAAFVGAGAYTVAIAAQHGLTSAWLAWPLAMLVAAALALAIGWVCLRTRGVYFIMITLAFAQMLYYLFVGLKTYGGDDGLSLSARSELGFDISQPVAFYFVVTALFAMVMLLFVRTGEARFGRVMLGIKENEARMEAVGFATFSLKLICFVIAGAVAGLAGALLVNLNLFVSPKSLHWTQSGTLMMMVILGGVGHRYGGVIGAVVYLLLEEVLSLHLQHWHMPMGIFLLLVVLFAPRGLAGGLRR